jgi:hypothetical protein
MSLVEAVVARIHDTRHNAVVPQVRQELANRKRRDTMKAANYPRQSSIRNNCTNVYCEAGRWVFPQRQNQRHAKYWRLYIFQYTKASKSFSYMQQAGIIHGYPT